MRTVVVGLAGGTASGKTTAAAALARRLGEACLVVSHDRYYRPLPATADPHAWNFDHPDAFETPRLVDDLALLRAGRAVRLPRYDYATWSRTGEDRADPRPVVLVEGILVLADGALRAALDLRVYVDAPEDVRLRRRLRRDVAERGWTEAQVHDRFASHVRPMHDAHVAPSRAHADLLLDGTADPESLVDAVLRHLEVP